MIAQISKQAKHDSAVTHKKLYIYKVFHFSPPYSFECRQCNLMQCNHVIHQEITPNIHRTSSYTVN